MDPEEPPQPGIPIRLPMVAIDVVSWCSAVPPAPLAIWRVAADRPPSCSALRISVPRRPGSSGQRCPSRLTTCACSLKGTEYRKNKATFHASPPASPRLSRMSPLEVPLSRPSPPAAGERGRPPGRPPGARHPRRAPGRRRRLLHWGCKRLGRLAWDGCHPLAHAAEAEAETGTNDGSGDGYERWDSEHCRSESRVQTRASV